MSNNSCICKYCHTVYNNPEEAQACEALGITNEPKYKAGDRFDRWGMITIVEPKVILKSSSKQPRRHMVGYTVNYPTRTTWLSEKALEDKGLYR